MSKKKAESVEPKVWAEQRAVKRYEINVATKVGALAGALSDEPGAGLTGVNPTPPIDLYMGELADRIESLNKAVARLAERTGPFRTPESDHPHPGTPANEKCMSNFARILSDYCDRLAETTARVHRLAETIEI